MEGVDSVPKLSFLVGSPVWKGALPPAPGLFLHRSELWLSSSHWQTLREEGKEAESVGTRAEEIMSKYARGETGA